jgi:hypothetical protein
MEESQKRESIELPSEKLELFEPSSARASLSSDNSLKVLGIEDIIKKDDSDRKTQELVFEYERKNKELEFENKRKDKELEARLKKERIIDSSAILIICATALTAIFILLNPNPLQPNKDWQGILTTITGGAAGYLFGSGKKNT